jgi:formate-dependent nitrite reductase membrane component NrfD
MSAGDGDRDRLGSEGVPPAPAPEDEPPHTAAGRQDVWVADHTSADRDTRPAIGTRGEPGAWRRAVEDARVRLARPAFGDAWWSYLFKDDTAYATDRPAPGEIATANRDGRDAPPADGAIHGPLIKAPVWTWEVPLYFWVGGVASGSSFVALACDAAGDRRSASTARLVALAAVAPAPALLIADLGRPERFLNMLRIIKPRSPMNLGAWCLVAFSAADAAAVAADVLGLGAAARGLGAATAILGGYLGSYTGVLLAATAVPVWSRSRSFLGPIFVSTATATGAALTRLVLVGRGLPAGHPTRVALGRVESGAIGVELVLSAINERRLGPAGRAMKQRRPRALFRLAEAAVVAGLVLRLAGERTHVASSGLYLAGGLAFRYAWVEVGRVSARDDEAVSAVARGAGAPNERRELSHARTPGRTAPALAWTETVRRVSLFAERALRRRDAHR